jgi:hypothetical protein
VANPSTLRKLAALLTLAVAPTLTGNIHPRYNFDGRLLAAHNRERSAAGIPELEWSDELAASAEKWARHLGRTGAFEHSPDEVGRPVEGENLWAGTRGYYTPESMVQLWSAEKRYFKPGVFPNNSRTGDVEQVGHYTQLMWRKTMAVGCALAQSRVEDVLVCRYSTAGNVTGETPY